MEQNKTIEINNILVWDKNPRFGYSEDIFSDKFKPSYSNDDDIIKFLVKHESEIEYDGEEKKSKLEEFKELIESLLANGYNNDEPILVRKIQDNGKYYSLDGNRRISAIKILNYLKNNQQNWIEWFECEFTQNYFDTIKSKISDFSCEKILCKIIESNVDDNIIKKSIYRTDLINKLGKKYWPRIVRLGYIYKEYENLMHEKIDSNEIIKTLSDIFDKNKSSIKKDLDSAKWVMFCLKESNISRDKYNKWNISPLELARSKIIDPCSGLKLGEILNIEQINESFRIGQNTKINRIKIKDLCIFLCECLEKKFYTTREWKPRYYAELTNFLYQDTDKNKNLITTTPLKNLNDVLTGQNNQNFSDEDKKNGGIIHKKYTEINKIYEIIRKKIEKLNTKKDILLEKINHKFESEENNCAVHFCSFITFLYHEITNQRFIGDLSAQNFPYALFSLLFRNTFAMMISIIFINHYTNEIFINELKKQKLANIEIINRRDIKIKFIDLLEQTDWRSPSEFSSFEKITNSIFYRRSPNVYGFFTKDDRSDEEEKIINLFISLFPSLFNIVYKQICKKLEINQNEIDDDRFIFFTKFLNNNKSYDKSYDFLCRNIHSDIYIVTTYSPSSTKAYSDVFCKIKEFFSDFSVFIESLIG